MDIAITGLSCRFPSDSSSAVDLWEMLSGNSNSITPLNKRDYQAFKKHKGSAALLEHPFDFDPECFSLTPEQAACIDPSSRLLLMLAHELKWQCGLSDSDVSGLFISSGDSGFALHHHPEDYSYELASGHYSSLCAGRVARHLKSVGPVLQLDSASSSSLLTLHYAIKSLENHECSVAFAGGVNLISHPVTGERWTDLGALSSGAQSCPFSADSDGFVRGEGGGLVALMRLDDALKNGSPVYGVIKACSVVQDWHSETLTSPSVQGQVAMLEAALRQSGWSKNDLDYIEAHGSGTPVGDTIELEALNQVFSGRDYPLPIGSGKGHHGHLEVAAGIAGLFKVLAIFAWQSIPETLTRKPLHPSLSQFVDLELVDQFRQGKIQKAGVTSLGMGGTQVHIQLENTLREEPEDSVPLVLTADTKQHLDHLLKQACNLTERFPECWKRILWSLTCQARPAPFIFCAEINDISQLKLLRQGKAGAVSGQWQQKFEHFLAGKMVNWSSEGRRFALLPGLNYPFQLTPCWPSELQMPSILKEKQSKHTTFSQPDILQWLCETSKVLTGNKIQPESGLFAAGLTSFQASQLRQSIQKKFSCRIPQTLIFNYPNCQALSYEILRRVNQPIVNTNPEKAPDIQSEHKKEEWVNDLILELSS